MSAAPTGTLRSDTLTVVAATTAHHCTNIVNQGLANRCSLPLERTVKAISDIGRVVGKNLRIQDVQIDPTSKQDLRDLLVLELGSDATGEELSKDRRLALYGGQSDVVQPPHCTQKRTGIPNTEPIAIDHEEENAMTQGGELAPVGDGLCDAIGLDINTLKQPSGASLAVTQVPTLGPNQVLHHQVPVWQGADINKPNQSNNTNFPEKTEKYHPDKQCGPNPTTPKPLAVELQQQEAAVVGAQSNVERSGGGCTEGDTPTTAVAAARAPQQCPMAYPVSMQPQPLAMFPGCTVVPLYSGFPVQLQHGPSPLSPSIDCASTTTKRENPLTNTDAVVSNGLQPYTTNSTVPTAQVAGTTVSATPQRKKQKRNNADGISIPFGMKPMKLSSTFTSDDDLYGIY